MANPVETSSDSDDGMTVIQYDDSSDSLEEVDDGNRKLEQGSYVIVKYCSKRHVAHLVGQVTKMTDEGI